MTVVGQREVTGTSQIRPILLCGGSGTRLWPLSRQEYPKQFASIEGKISLLQQAALRLSGEGFLSPVALTASEFRFLVTEQLSTIGVAPAAVLIEPDARNTGPAILAAALFAAQTSPADLLLIAPSDHVMSDPDGFRAAVKAACPTAQSGNVVTFGITPTRAETGYGWLQPGNQTGSGPWPLEGFVEKPEANTARTMFESGAFLWNAGIYLARADVLIALCKEHAPEFFDAVDAAVREARSDLGFLRLDAEAWSGAQSISIDYAVMEKAKGLMVMPYSGGWSDLGDWLAVLRETAGDRLDAAGNFALGAVTQIDCHGSLLHADQGATRLVAIGLQDIVAIAMPDAVLIADKARTQEVKLAVALMKEAGARQAETFAEAYRPWGTSALLAEGDGFQVRRVIVKPGGAMRLQSHLHRAEHWVVVQGTARVTLGDKVQLVSENESIYVPLGVIHRVENPGKMPVTMIEVHTGRYMGADDVVRYDP